MARASNRPPVSLDAPRSVRQRDVGIVVAIFLLATVPIALTATDPGLTWDEPIYVGFSVRFVQWFGGGVPDRFSADTLSEFWWNAQVHPPLGKLWTALFIRAFYPLGIVAAARIGAAVIFGICAVVLYVWSANKRGRASGLIAAGAFMLMPRVFGHACFANLEMATVLVCLATTVAFEKGIRSARWSVFCGVLFGLALLTKVNAVFLPVILIPWGLLFHGRRAIRNIVAMMLIGPALFLIGWPALWHQPVARTWEYLVDKTNRPPIPAFYLGTEYAKPFAPFHYPIVMLLATTPLLILAGLAIGVRKCVQALAAKWRDADHEALVLWSFAFPVLLLAMPFVPKYDGIRLMLPAYPFLAALAAHGVLAGWAWLAPRLKQPRRAAARLIVLGLFWLLLPLAMFHPFHLSYYGELVGGPWGAERLGFETTYWDDTLNSEARTFLDKRIEEKGTLVVAGAAVEPLIWQYYYTVHYPDRQPLPPEPPEVVVVEFGPMQWDYLVVVMRQSMLDKDLQRFRAANRPVWRLGLPPFDTPTICEIYRNPSSE